MNYYEFWVGSFRKKTRRLSMIERGAYRELLDEIYAMDGEGLPVSKDELYNIAGAVSDMDRAAVDKVSDLYFELGPDGLLHQVRATEEVAKASKRISIARENGKLSHGRPKKTQPVTGGLTGGLPAETHQGPNGSTPQTTPTLLPTVESRGEGSAVALPLPPASPPPTPPATAVAAVDNSVKKTRKRKEPRAKAAWIPPGIGDDGEPEAKPTKWVPPEWMPLDAWTGFVKHRKAMHRVPFTEMARDRIVERLAQFKSKGLDVRELLLTAVERGWKTVFEPDRRMDPAGDRRGPARELQWWESYEGLQEKARELGVAEPPDDLPSDRRTKAVMVFRARVYIAAGDGPWIARMDETTRLFYESELRRKDGGQ